MDYRKVILVAAFFCPAAYASYAQLTPPPGWSAGTGAGATYQAASASEFSRLMARPVATLAGARVPVSLAVASSAPRYLAGAMAVLGTGGLVLGLAGTAITLIPAIQEWFDSAGVRWSGGNSGRWEVRKDGVMWRAAYCPSEGAQCLFGSPEAAIRYSIEKANSTTDLSNCKVVSISGNTAYGGCTYNPNGNFLNDQANRVSQPARWEAATYEQVKPMLSATPIPENLPNVVWPASWPVNDPVINPDSTGKPSALFVPTGNPVKNPNYDSTKPISESNNPYFQPGIRITPSPTSSNPWQVDVQPVNRPVDSSDPKPDPVSEPGGNEPPNGDKPRDDDRDLCQKNPDIIACQKLEKPEEIKLQTKEVEFNFQPEGGFGGSAACPPPTVVTVGGQTLTISWQGFCDQLAIARLGLLALAWLSAAFILLGHKE